jgi:uncharacterized protein
MVLQRISLVTIGARNLPALRSFYQRLGWQEKEGSNDDYCVFTNSGVLLSLFPIEELSKDAGVSFAEIPQGYNPITLAINVDTPDQVDETADLVEAAGAVILRRPSDAFWGGRTAYFADPENNLWEIAWNPTSVFDERGAMMSF